MQRSLRMTKEESFTDEASLRFRNDVTPVDFARRTARSFDCARRLRFAQDDRRDGASALFEASRNKFTNSQDDGRKKSLPKRWARGARDDSKGAKGRELRSRCDQSQPGWFGS